MKWYGKTLDWSELARTLHLLTIVPQAPRVGSKRGSLYVVKYRFPWSRRPAPFAFEGPMMVTRNGVKKFGWENPKDKGKEADEEGSEKEAGDEKTKTSWSILFPLTLTEDTPEKKLLLAFKEFINAYIDRIAELLFDEGIIESGENAEDVRKMCFLPFWPKTEQTDLAVKCESYNKDGNPICTTTFIDDEEYKKGNIIDPTEYSWEELPSPVKMQPLFCHAQNSLALVGKGWSMSLRVRQALIAEATEDELQHVLGGGYGFATAPRNQVEDVDAVLKMYEKNEKKRGREKEPKKDESRKKEWTEKDETREWKKLMREAGKKVEEDPVEEEEEEEVDASE